jgi:hypothetical protein
VISQENPKPKRHAIHLHPFDFQHLESASRRARNCNAPSLFYFPTFPTGKAGPSASAFMEETAPRHSLSSSDQIASRITLSFPIKRVFG